jgi:hypothetical protein
MILTSMSEILQNILPTKGNRIVSGIVKYYTDDYKDALIQNEKSKLLSRLAEHINDKPIIIICNQQEITSDDNINHGTVVITLATYYVSLLDCEIGDICYYEDSLESSHFELESDCYHFKKIEDSEHPLWLRIA